MPTLPPRTESKKLIPYLIQRGQIDYTRTNKTGIDKILSFDYMGSSEFEWGALPDSLKAIRSNLEQYKCETLIVNKKKVTVFHYCDHAVIDEYIKVLADNKARLKEPSYFDQFISGKGFNADRFDFWWDVDNHIMFWEQSNIFETQFKELINGK